MTEHDSGSIPRLALRPREAALALGISERTLFAWTDDPTSGIPVIRIGNIVLYPVRDIQDWLSSKAEGSSL